MLRFSCGQDAAADSIENAVNQALNAGYRTGMWPETARV